MADLRDTGHRRGTAACEEPRHQHQDRQRERQARATGSGVGCSCRCRTPRWHRRAVFDGDPCLVPVPRSGLTKAHTVWPARRRNWFVRDSVGCRSRDFPGGGCGHERRQSRAASAGGASGVAGRSEVVRPPSRLLLVDDVATSGTTLMACMQRLADAFPGVPITAFALARVQSQGEPIQVFEPIVEEISVSGSHCVRGPVA